MFKESSQSLVKKSKIPLMKPYIRADPYMTYKVSDPITLKRTKILNSSSCGPNRRPLARRLKSDPRPKLCDESDRGYQSEEALKYISGRFSDLEISEDVPKSSTKINIDASSFEIDAFDETDEVFDNVIPEEKVDLDESEKVNHECSHSQCQQCMLDMLWKNRIRYVTRSPESGKRSELIRKLQAIFGRDLFDSIYNVMISNWDTGENSPTVLNDITHSLSYSQLQNLPLMMQLIQLDLVAH